MVTISARRQAKQPFPQLRICRNSEPHFPEAGAGAAALRAAPLALGSALWGSPHFSGLPSHGEG
eukprot:8553401-Alexandrium_andersonii.AAC.1